MGIKASMKILVIDELDTMRKITRTMLKDAGLKNSEETTSNTQALELIKKAHQDGEPYGLIISDYNSPGMNTIEFVESLRGQDEFKTLPVLMVTAEADQSIIVTAIKAGVNNFVVKPYSAKVLKEKLIAIFK